MMTNDKAVKFLSRLPAYMIACKTDVHFPTLGNAEHLYSDELYDLISNFYDSIAEDMQFTYGRMEKSQYEAINIDFDSLEELVRALREEVIEFRLSVDVDGNPYDLGVLSLIDDFIHSLNVSGYRSQLS